jgi:ADP-heptose:LPS heptosyltransferase
MIVGQCLNMASQARKLKIPITTFMIAQDPYLRQFVEMFTAQNKGKAFLTGLKGLGEMIALLNECDGVVAPSTGPMHLAVALGKKVVSVFPPIKVQSAVRWGPYGVPMGTNLGISPEDKASVLVPDVNCAEDFRCALSACIYYPCMPRISVDDVETQLLALVEGGAVSMFKSSAMHELEEFEENE